jgi:HSP20 family protein
MTKTKRSFFAKLTGTSRIDEDILTPENSRPVSLYEDDSQQESFMQVDTNPTQSFAHSPTNTQWEQEPEENDGQLTIDMYQTEAEIVIKSTIAGVKPEDIDVSINNDMITIRGARHMEEEVSEDRYYYQECYWGSFSRSVVLPVDVLADKVEASLKNGILTVRLPKADINKVKKIQVRGF